MSTPFVSIVIPTYKHARFIAETLASVFAQTFQDFEVIVINDGSPDDTAAVLKPWIDAGRIRYFEQPNAGQSATRNRGISLARGEFLALLDDDDLWPADKLAWQVGALQKNPSAVLCYGFTETFGMARNYRVPLVDGPQGAVGPELLVGNPISSPGQVLLRIENVRKAGGFDAAIQGTEDWDLWIRLSRMGDFVYENRCSLRYRLQSQNASQNVPKMFRAGIQVVHKHLGRTPLGPGYLAWFRARSFVGRFTSTMAMGQARQWSDEQRTMRSLWSLIIAVRFYPVLLGTKRFWRACRQSLKLPAKS